MSENHLRLGNYFRSGRGRDFRALVLFSRDTTVTQEQLVLEHHQKPRRKEVTAFFLSRPVPFRVSGDSSRTTQEVREEQIFTLPAVSSMSNAKTSPSTSKWCLVVVSVRNI